MFYEKLAEKSKERAQKKSRLGLAEGALVGGLGAAAGAHGTLGGVAKALKNPEEYLAAIERPDLDDYGAKALGLSEADAKRITEQSNRFYKRLGFAGLRGLGQAGAVGGLSYAGLKKLKKVRDAREERGEDRVTATEKAVGGAAKLYAGKKALDAGAERVLGVQRFVHGTSDDAAKAILREGLKAEHGGSSKGSSAALGGPAAEYYQEGSKGKIHIFKDTPLRRRLARGHANLAQKGGDFVPFVEGVGGLPGQGSGGTRIYGAMPFEELERNFELDTDYGGVAHRSIVGKDADIAGERLSKKRVGLAGIIKNRSKDLGGYISRNKGRFALGLGGLGAAGALGYSGAKDIVSATKRKQEKKTAAFMKMLSEG